MAVRQHRGATGEAVQQSLAALVATIGVLTLYEYLLGGPSGFDLLLFGDRVHQVSADPAGRISINTAGSLLLIGLALLSIPHDQRKHDFRAQMFATPALFIGLIALLGYVFGVKGASEISQSSVMALTTAVCLTVLCIGTLVAVPDRGVASLPMDEGAAGVLTRRLLPAALLAPIILGIIRMLGESAGIYESEFGVSLFAVAAILTFVGLVLWSARVLRDTDRERVICWRSGSARATPSDCGAKRKPRARKRKAPTTARPTSGGDVPDCGRPSPPSWGTRSCYRIVHTGPVTELQRQRLGRINASASSSGPDRRDSHFRACRHRSPAREVRGTVRESHASDRGGAGVEPIMAAKT
jgi:hypothetical protein